MAASAFLSITWLIAAAEPEHKAIPINAIKIVETEIQVSGIFYKDMYAI